MQTLTFNITDTKREIKQPTNVENFNLTFGDQSNADLPHDNWVQARQNGDDLRQIFVDIKQGPAGNETAYDVTGFVLQFAGRTAVASNNKSYRIIDNSSVVIDGPNGRLRYTFPAAAFAVAGAYKQAYFRLIRESDYKCIATLEFDLTVLQDFVFSDMLPSDWISPFEDIHQKLLDNANNFEKELQSSFDTATQRINDTVTQLTNLGTTVNEALQAAKSSLSALETKIQENGLFTQKEAATFETQIKTGLQELLDKANNSVVGDYAAKTAVDPEEMYGEAMPSYFADSFRHVTQDVPHGDSIVNIAFITDNHHQEDQAPESSKAYSGRSLEHYQWFAQSTLAVHPDVAIANGDNINGDSFRATNRWTTQHVWAMLNTIDVNTPFFMLPGNHDTGIGQTAKLDPSLALNKADLQSLYHTTNPLFGEQRDNNSLYFYKDLEAKKVRIVGLDSSDLPWTVDSSGNYVHDRLNEAGFGTDQLKWLVNVALKLPANDWQVIFFFHHPLELPKFINKQAFIDIITAFKNGTATTINRSDATDMAIIGLKVDFTSQGSGSVIAVVNGHYHSDGQDLTMLSGTPIIITDASLSNTLEPNVSRRGTANEDCWEYLSIDTDKRSIHCYRFGRGSDREFTY